METSKQSQEMAKILKSAGRPHTAEYIEMFGEKNLCPFFWRKPAKEQEAFYKKCVDEMRPWDYFIETPEGYDEGVLTEIAPPPMESEMNEDGGPGSGNFGHQGRPGKVGGAPNAADPKSSRQHIFSGLAENPLDNPGNKDTITIQGHTDGGPGSGNHGHKGVPGQVGGSAPRDGGSPKSLHGVERSSLKHGFGRTNTKGSNGNDSLAKYTGSDGELTPERENLHASIVAKQLVGVNKPEGQPTYTFLGGGPAAGKSTIKNLPEAGYLSGSDAVEIDSDAIKGELPEYRNMVAAKDETAAAYCHEESSALAKRTSTVASENGYNVSLDGTGDGSVESMLSKIRAAKEAGMVVNGVYVTIPTELALSRAMERAAKTGRMVPVSQITTIHRKVSQILPEIASEFDSVKLYDNSGSTPRLIATGGSGKGLTPVDEQAYNDFLKKGQ